MNCRSAVSVCPLSSRSSQLRLVNDKRDLDRYTTQSVLRSTLTLQTADCQPAHRDRHSKGLAPCGDAAAPSTSPGLRQKTRRRGTPHDTNCVSAQPFPFPAALSGRQGFRTQKQPEQTRNMFACSSCVVSSCMLVGTSPRACVARVKS